MSSFARTREHLRRRRLLLWRLGHRKGVRAHRYFRYRLAAFAAVHLLVAAIPLLGILRFDFWRGNHLLFGHPAPFLQTLRDFVIPFGLVNVGIVLLVRWSGRFLCGWVCPVNFMNRWADWLRGRLGRKDASFGLAGQAIALAVSLLFASLFLLWFVDPAVLWVGSPRARLATLGGWLALGAVSWIQIAGPGWNTCSRFCPSGVYFSVLGARTQTGIERRPDGSPCEDCGLCVKACPMELEPRDLLGRAREPLGFYFSAEDASGYCIRCGDCVEACERYFERRGLPATLRMGFLQGTGSALPPSEEGAEREPEAPAEASGGTAA